MIVSVHFMAYLLWLVWELHGQVDRPLEGLP
jgi:hypothetical protein